MDIQIEPKEALTGFLEILNVGKFRLDFLVTYESGISCQIKYKNKSIPFIPIMPCKVKRGYALWSGGIEGDLATKAYLFVGRTVLFHCSSFGPG